MSQTFTVYILASLSRRLYVGMTADLLHRIQEHRTAILPSFTGRYRINRLVYYEQTNDVKSAVQRETEIRQWPRERKIQLIESANMEWLDLAEDWFGSNAPGASPDRGSSETVLSPAQPAARAPGSGQAPRSALP